MKCLNSKLQAGIAVGLAIACMLLAVPASADQSETTTTIDVPGAVVTVASGINRDGVITGWYCRQLPCNAANTRGFLLSDGVFTYIDVPNSPDRPAIGTQPRYISPQGVVIGAYFTLQDGSSIAAPRFRGFAWYGGSLTYFDAPDWIYDNPSSPHSIIPRAINARGHIVGCIHDRDQMNSMHGFELSDGQFTKFGPNTMHSGITDSGEIVGLDFTSAEGYHIDKFGNVERLVMPGADQTYAWDINSRGTIVGIAWTNGSTVQHAFLRSKHGFYRSIDPAGALAAQAFGINSDGDVVGSYRDAAGPQCATTACMHGFLLQRGEN